MDPNATFRALLAALDERDTSAAREAFDALAAWLDNGGFRPTALSLAIAALD